MKRIGVFCALDYPKYKLIKDLVHYILSGCVVHYGLRCHDKLFQQVLMFFRAITRGETNLYSVEFVPSLTCAAVSATAAP